MNGLENIVAGEEKTTEKGSRPLFAQYAHLADLVENAMRRIQAGVGLRIITDTYIVTEMNLPAQRRQFTNNSAQQGGLTRTIGTEQANTITAQQLQVSYPG